MDAHTGSDTATHTQNSLTALTAEIVAGYVSNHTVSTAEIGALISTVHNSLASLGKPAAATAAPSDMRPAVPIRKSIMPDYIICLEDGRKMKTLKRHLRTVYNMTPDEYRAKWNLPADYPMVAPNYAVQRSQMAKDIGLGRRHKEVPAPPPPVTPGSRRRGAPRAAAE